VEQEGLFKRVRRREQFVEEVLKELFERTRNEVISPGGCRIDELQETVTKDQYLQNGSFLTDLILKQIILLLPCSEFLVRTQRKHSPIRAVSPSHPSCFGVLGSRPPTVRY
jgi:hypothetical protein